MLLSRSSLCFLIVFLLNGCGFSSIYSTKNHTELPNQFSTIKINQIPNRIGQMVRNELLDLLTPHGPPISPRCILFVTIDETKNAFAIQKNAIATRADIRLIGNYQLISVEGSRQLTSGTIYIVSSYDIVSSDFATLASEKNARKRVVMQLSEDIRTRLAVYFVRQSKLSR